MRPRILISATALTLLTACDRRTPIEVELTHARASASASIANFHFELDRLEVVGNIPGNFVDEFDDRSLTSPPTSHFLCFGTVAERAGTLVLTSADGSNTLSPGVLVDNCFLGQLTGTTRLVRGRGDAVATAAFRADVPTADQGYGIQIVTIGSSEGVNIQVGSDPLGSAPRSVVITSARGGAPPNARVVVDFTGVDDVLLRLELRDANGEVVPSFSTDGGSTFHGLPSPGGVFGASNEAMVSVFGFMVGSSPRPPVSYRPPFSQPGVIDLGTLGGISSNATAINAHGVVVGTSLTLSGAPHAFVRQPGTGMQDLGTLGGLFSSANDINAHDQVVGSSAPAVNTPLRAFLWSVDQGMMDLGTLGGTQSSAFGIDDFGRVVGQSLTVDGSPRAFLWTAGAGMQDLGTLGGTVSGALAINNGGQVVGSSRTEAELSNAFLWTAESGMIDLGTLGGSVSSARAINESGHVVGRSTLHPGDAITQSHAFLWTPEHGMVDLGTLGGSFSEALGINDGGEVVGRSTTAPGQPTFQAHAFLWTAKHGMRDLGTLGGCCSQAAAIRSLGQIVGTSTTASGASHATLWTIASAMP